MSIKFCDFHALGKISNISNHKLYKMPKKFFKNSLKIPKSCEIKYFCNMAHDLLQN